MNKNKCLIYARIASRRETRSGMSMNLQIELVKPLAKKLGLTISKIYTEIGSARAKNRPAFREMLEEIKTGEADVILCTGIERLSRDFLTMAKLIELMRSKGLRIVTLNGEFGGKSEDFLPLAVQTALAEKYSLDHGNRIRRASETRKAKPSFKVCLYHKISSAWQTGKSKIVKDVLS